MLGSLRKCNAVYVPLRPQAHSPCPTWLLAKLGGKSRRIFAKCLLTIVSSLFQHYRHATFFFFFSMCRLSHLSSHSISPFLGKLSLPLTCSRYLGEALMVWISQVLPTLHQGPWITFAPPGAPGQGQRKFSPYSLH